MKPSAKALPTPCVTSFSKAGPLRCGQRRGLVEYFLLLVMLLALAACETSSDSDTSDPFVKGDDGLTPPAVTAPASITVAATNAAGTAATDPAIAAFLAGASAFDAGDGAIATITNDGPAIYALGITTVTFSATDSDGNTGTARATVTVADQTAPLITLQGLASITLAVGDPFTDPGAIASDNVDGDLSFAIVTGGAVNSAAVGLYTLTYDVSDTAGNAAIQVTRSVSVQDGGAPVVTPPANIIAAAVDATGTAATVPAIAAFLAGASALDAVDGPIATVTNDAPAQFPLGVTTVTFSATDSSANTGQAQATVNVTDQTAPVVTPPADLTIAATGPSGIAATEPAIVAFLAGASASDNVDGAIATITNNAPALLPVNVTTTVTFTATDAAGNSGNAQATVTVTPFVSVQMVAFSREVGGQLDLFAIAEDGSGSLVTLADDPGDEVFAGSSSDNRVVYVRDTGGGLNDIFSINDDGSGSPITLTNDANDELPVAITADNEVIFMRSMTAPGPHSDLYSVPADGSGGVIPLATSVDSEIFGGLTSDGRLVYDITDFATLSDVYSIRTNGSGGAAALAATPEFEAGGGIAAGNVLIFARTVGGFGSQSDIYTINADGLSGATPLVATTDDELPVGVTAGDLVIFMRISGFTFNLRSIGASGSPAEAQLASADGLAGELLTYGSATGGRVIFNRCSIFSGLCDVFSRNEDGSGVEATLAADPLSNEAFAGISSDGRVIIVRDGGVTTELVSVNADGTDPVVLASAPTPVPPGEVFKGVTANGRVIFERDVGGQTDLFSILADGSGPEVPLATGTTNESFGGTF